MTRALVPLSLLTATLLLAPSAPAELQLPRPSPKASVSQTIGLTDVSVTYSRPSVKGRVIWGELVPWGKPWRTGANEATTVTVSDDVTVDGQKLAAGSYALVTIPGKDEWTVIFNKDLKLWTENEYDAAKDVLRLKVKPQTAELHEALQFGFPSVTTGSGQLELRWERLKLALTIETDAVAKTTTLAKKEIEKAEADAWRTPYRAARWAYDSKALTAQAEAAAWVDKSIAVKETFQNLGLKAQILADQGKTREAVALGEKALQLGKASPDKPNTSSLEKLLADWKAKK